MGRAWAAAGDAGRGVSDSLTPSYGADAGGPERLWSQPDAGALAANGTADPSGWLDAEAGFGTALLGDRFTGTPNVGFGLSDAARECRIGWRLDLAVPGDSGFEVRVDATRRETPGGSAPPEHGVMLRSSTRW